MAKATKIRTLDNKLPRMLRILEEYGKLAEKPYVKVGYPAENSETNAPKTLNLEDDKKGFAHSALQLIDVVLWMEFGTARVPERSFIRSTHDEIKDEMKDFIADLVGQIHDGNMTVERALDLIGLKTISKMKAKIRSGIAPPLTLATIARKGSSIPLIDTGQLLNGMTFKRIMKP